MENMDIDGMSENEIQRLVSQRQIALIDGKPVTDENLKSLYHGITTVSQGVLSHVALGGL